jgi:hypothetical protein
MEREEEIQMVGAATGEPEAAREDSPGPGVDAERRWSDGEALSLFEA